MNIEDHARCVWTLKENEQDYFGVKLGRKIPCVNVCQMGTISVEG